MGTDALRASSEASGTAGLAPLFLLPRRIDATSPVVRMRLRGRVEGEGLDFAAVRVHGEQWYLEERVEGGLRFLEAELGERRGTSIFALESRPMHGVDGRRVVRSAKALCYVPRGAWAEVEASPAACARFGTALEIVPLRDPLTVQLGEALPIRVRFQGPGLSGATVVAVHEEGDAREVVSQGTTATVGELDVEIARAGLWHLIVEHLHEDGDAVTAYVSTMSFRIGEAR